MPDPILKSAMEEIKAVLKKHDIAANVILASKTHLEYLRQVETSWTALRMERDAAGRAVGIRFRCKQADYPTKEEWKEAMRLSICTMLGFVEVLNSDSKALMTIIRQLPSSMNIEHMSIDEGPGDATR
jgi:hypothetical protein